MCAMNRIVVREMTLAEHMLVADYRAMPVIAIY